MVVTLVGEPDAVSQAVLAAADVAVKSIDIATHKGVHPRLGVLDVIPIVPLKDIDMAACGQIARRPRPRDCGTPRRSGVFFYEHGNGERRALPDVRPQGFHRPLSRLRRPTSPHPTAGATVVRRPAIRLIAYNIVLDVADPAAAPRRSPESCGTVGVAHFKGVRALGTASAAVKAYDPGVAEHCRRHVRADRFGVCVQH